MDASWGIVEGDPIIVTIVVAAVVLAALTYVGQRLWQLRDEQQRQGRPRS